MCVCVNSHGWNCCRTTCRGLQDGCYKSHPQAADISRQKYRLSDPQHAHSVNFSWYVAADSPTVNVSRVKTAVISHKIHIPDLQSIERNFSCVWILPIILESPLQGLKASTFCQLGWNWGLPVTLYTAGRILVTLGKHYAQFSHSLPCSGYVCSSFRYAKPIHRSPFA